MRQSVNAKASLTARMTVRAVTKVGVSDPAVCEWKCRRSTDKSYPGDNRLIVRELGSERRETVRSLSVVGVGYLRGAVPSTRGPGWTHLWCTSCHASGTAGQLCAERINAEGI